MCVTSGLCARPSGTHGGGGSLVSSLVSGLPPSSEVGVDGSTTVVSDPVVLASASVAAEPVAPLESPGSDDAGDVGSVVDIVVLGSTPGVTPGPSVFAAVPPVAPTVLRVATGGDTVGDGPVCSVIAVVESADVGLVGDPIVESRSVV